MKRPLIAAISVAVLLAGASTVAQADDPPSPEQQFADTGLPEKADLEAADAQAHLDLEAIASSPSALADAIATKAADAIGRPADVLPEWEEGIFNVTDAPASTTDFVPTTLWSGHLLTGLHVSVYAGQQGSESTDGRVLLSVFDEDGNELLGRTIDIPGAQTLTVASADALGVVLTDATGGSWTLNPLTGLIL